MRRMAPAAILSSLLAIAVTACGGGSTQIIRTPVIGVVAKTPQAGQKLGFPAVATKNTTRVAGADPVADAAGVALAVYPSSAPGTHPSAVTIAPTDDWEAAIASSVLMAPPIKAPILLSGSSSLPLATSDALAQLAPKGSGAGGAAEVIRVGDVPAPPHLTLGGDLRQGSVHAGGGDRSLRQRRRGDGQPGRDDRLGRRPALRDAGRRLGRRERQPDPVRVELRRAAGDEAGAALPPASAHLRARPVQRRPRLGDQAARQVRHGHAGGRERSRRQLGRVRRLPRPGVARPGSPASTSPEASAGRSAVPGTGTPWSTPTARSTRPRRRPSRRAAASAPSC